MSSIAHRLLLSVAAFAALSSCSSFKDSSPQSSLNQAAIGPSGRYEALCLVDGDTSRQEAWVFASNVSRYFHQTTSFSDKACKSAATTVAPAGTYKIILNSSQDYDLDLHVVQPPGTPDEFTTLRLVQKNLYMATKNATSDGTSPANRAREINESVVFTHVDP